MRNQRAFTLLELVIVVATIGVLLTLLLPAIQRAREAAARMQGANRVRQIGAAFHQYAQANNSRLPEAKGARSAYYQILPWLEHGSYWADVEANRRPYNDDYVMDVYISPGDPTLPLLNLRKGAASYAYSGQVFVGQEVKFPDRTVTFPRRPTLTEKFFADGFSNTIFIAEHYAFGCDGTQFSWAWSGPTLHTTVGQRKASIRRSSFADAGDIVPDPTVTPVVTFQVRPAIADCDPRVPQTPYPSGMLVGMADGSVRVLNATTSPGAF